MYLLPRNLVKSCGERNTTRLWKSSGKKTAFSDSTTASFWQAEKGSSWSNKLCAEFPSESCPSLIHFHPRQPQRSRQRRQMACGRTRHTRCNSAPEMDVARFLTEYIWFPLLPVSLSQRQSVSFVFYRSGGDRSNTWSSGIALRQPHDTIQFALQISTPHSKKQIKFG